ncbi:SusC/RagA family TonB-linked outer membrane protein [Parapedobacter tibetensis]|uniref:SusC/RagA family TonB-linked outer membrane protein n=1 Tax=Parapedobacter tibetensis TaxID=2972951 RepID=UPI00214D20BA|nr:TonB-dependent receptor [Parapedobacter tibetensis]
MRFYLLIGAIILPFLQLSFAGHAQGVSIRLNNAPIAQVFKAIKEQTGYVVVHNDPQLSRMHVSVQLKDATVQEVMQTALTGKPYSFKIVDSNILVRYERHPVGVVVAAPIVQQQRTINGIVISSEGEPLADVTVSVKGTNLATVTDAQGRYSLVLPAAGEPSLVFSLLGYGQREVSMKGEGTTINITLQSVVSDLDEVVVVGYGIQKKVNLTGAVDRIDGERLAALQVNTIGEALQGQVAGVNVGIADGKPGRAASFNIRGTTSINEGGPLIVIDGVPQSGTDLNNIPPQDIEDISILKDAASTAIYGARASFGVILVTTKKGRKDGVQIQYSNYFGYSASTRVPEVYDNPMDYLEINQNEFNGNIGQTYWTDAQVEYPKQVAADPSLPYAQVAEIGGRPNLLVGGKVYNYYKEWLRKYTPKQNHRLNVNGGTDRFQYYVSADFNYEEGLIKFKPEKINRYGLRSNLNYKINDHISIFNYTTLVKRDEEHPNQFLYNFTSNVFRFIENSHPMMPEYVEVDGQSVPTDLGFYKEFLRDKSGIQDDDHDAKSTLGLDMSFLDNDLKVHVDATYQFRNVARLRWWDNAGPYLSNSFNNRNIVLDFYSDAGPAKVYRSQGNTTTHNINAYATYSKVLGGHDFTIMGGYNQEAYDYRYNYGERIGPLALPQRALNLATGMAQVSDEDNRNSSRSVFSRVNYNWQGKYLFEINGSYFLSSKFTRENRGQGFIAGSAAWRLSEEGFFDPLKSVVNNLKIRASYGSIGNANIGSYDYLPILNVALSNFTLDGERVSYTSVPAPRSPNFTWETIETLGGGIDFAFLRNRLVGSFDYYQRTTMDMLANFRSLPSVFGANVPKENIAKLRNRGWELSVGWADRIRLGGSEFGYGVRANLSDYKSVITDYYNPTNYLQDYYVGQVIGEIWGLNTLGYFLTDEEAQNSPLLATSAYKSYAAAGTIKFEDVNNDGVISWADRTLDNPGDYQVIGNSTPRYQFGITLNAAWKGFDFNAFFRGVGKQDIYPGSEAVNFWGPYNRKYQVMLKHTVEERWTPENPNAYFPRPQGYVALASNDLGQPQTKYLQDASFIRLKNLVIGYTVSKPLRKIPLSSIRIYASGQNLWEATGLHFSLDPEGLVKDPDANARNVGLGTAYPVQRVYSFGIQANF